MSDHGNQQDKWMSSRRLSQIACSLRTSWLSLRRLELPPRDLRTMLSSWLNEVKRCKPSGVERQVLLHVSLRTKNDRLAKDSLDETERANFWHRRDELLVEDEAEHDMFVDKDDNWSDSGSVDRLEKEACTMYVDFDKFSLSQMWQSVTLLKVIRCSQPLPWDEHRSLKGNGWSWAYRLWWESLIRYWQK